MNGLLFGCAVVLTLGGAVYLLLGRRNVDRGIAGIVVAGGVGVFAAGVGVWAAVAVDILMIGTLLLATLQLRRCDSTAVAGVEHDNSDVARQPAIPSARKAFALLISAAIGGILLSVVWSNPIWRVRTLAEHKSASPGIGIVPILLIAVLPLLVSVAQFRGTLRNGSRSHRTDN